MPLQLAVLDFGTGSNTAITFVADTSILPTSKVDSMVSADDTTSSHTANDHKYFPCFVAISATPVGTTGIQVTAQSPEKLTGQFKIRLVWSN